MAIIRTEGRGRFGIHWHDNEAAADREAAYNEKHLPNAVASVNVGITQAGRDSTKDLRDEHGNVYGWAVIVP